MQDKLFDKLFPVLKTVNLFGGPFIPGFLTWKHLNYDMHYANTTTEKVFIIVLCVMIEISGVINIHTLISAYMYNFRMVKRQKDSKAFIALPAISFSIYMFCIAAINLAPKLFEYKIADMIITALLVLINVSAIASIITHEMNQLISKHNKSEKEREKAERDSKKPHKPVKAVKHIKKELPVITGDEKENTAPNKTKRLKQSLVKKYLGEGKEAEEIARLTGASLEAVKKHIGRIEKLNI